MPKIVVYVRSDDAHVIEAVENREIAQWVRDVVRFHIQLFHDQRAKELGAQRMPIQWMRHLGTHLEDGA